MKLAMQPSSQMLRLSFTFSRSLIFCSLLGLLFSFFTASTFAAELTQEPLVEVDALIEEGVSTDGSFSQKEFFAEQGSDVANENTGDVVEGG